MSFVFVPDVFGVVMRIFLVCVCCLMHIEVVPESNICIAAKVLASLGCFSCFPPGFKDYIMVTNNTSMDIRYYFGVATSNYVGGMSASETTNNAKTKTLHKRKSCVCIQNKHRRILWGIYMTLL